MCSVGSATGTSTDTCAASSPAHSARSEYVRFAAKDSDSDSDIEGECDEDAHGARDADEKEGGPAAVCASNDRSVTPPALAACSSASAPARTTVQRAGLTAVPDHNGVRFCRVCNAFLPLRMFPKGHRRYTCRPHLWQRVGKKARQAAYKAAPRRRLLASIWTRCWKDVNGSCLGMGAGAEEDSALALRQVDIAGMLDALEASQRRNFSLASLSAESSARRACNGALHSASAGCVQTGCVGRDDATAEGLLTALDTQRWTGMDAVAVLPADLSKPVSKENAVLVTKSTRGVLLDELRRARKALAEQDTPQAAARAEQQKQLAVLWRKSIQAATLLPAAPVGSDVSPEAVGSRSSGGS